jgi:molecular chaperone HtpG
MTATTTRPFETDINRLLHLIIGSVYSNRDVFLRELISNASDAIDKVRILKTSQSEADVDHFIKIKVESDNSIFISDNGIGMDEEDLINNLSTIAHSGTNDFAENLNMKNPEDFIGQFGVGFFSAFLVASHIEIVTRKWNTNRTLRWCSDGLGTYTIEKIPDSFEYPHGTMIKLSLKEDSLDYTKESELKRIIKKHSQFISYPIQLWVEKERERTEDDEVVEESDEDKDVVVEEEEEEAVKEKQKEEEIKKIKYHDWEKINCEKPLWYKEPSQISDDEYKELYKSISKHPHMDPVYWKHFKAEGRHDFQGIFFFSNMFGRQMESDGKSEIKLYVKKVLIMDDCSKEIVPEWCSFITGIVDSNDIPLNISREMLQQNQYMNSMKKYIQKQVLKMLDDFSQNKEQYISTFYPQHSRYLKWGIANGENALAKYLFWYHSQNEEEYISLDEYIEKHLKEDQKEIFFISGESIEEIKKSIYMERFLEKDICVLFFIESIDIFMIQRLPQYKDYTIVNIAKQFESKLFDDDKENKEDKTEENKLITFMKEFLKEKVQDVTISKRLTGSPACVAANRYGWSAHMEKVMRSQPLQDDVTSRMTGLPKYLEINIDHPLIKNMETMLEDESSHDVLKEKIEMLLSIATVQSGFTVSNVSQFCNKMYNMLYGGGGDLKSSLRLCPETSTSYTQTT